MRILAIEPYFDGSHRAFLEGWRDHSRHDWTVLDLPGYKWKWRMRHASLTLAKRLDQHLAAGCEWDLLFCSDMLNLPEMLGMSSSLRKSLPLVLYFHENQLTYPSRQPRDYQYAYSNFLSASRADRVWFNSEFHRNDFLDAIREFLGKMPDFRHLEAVDSIREKSEVQSPGISPLNFDSSQTGAALRILWCARWEHDKNPDDFFAAIRRLKADGHPFRLGVIGASFREIPACFERAKVEFEAEIDHWGYQSSAANYQNVLAWAWSKRSQPVFFPCFPNALRIQRLWGLMTTMCDGSIFTQALSPILLIASGNWCAVVKRASSGRELVKRFERGCERSLGRSEPWKWMNR